nr:diphthine--ammonia ligase [Quercus suber]
MPHLKVVALISGGKDSLFSMLHCLANGHDVVALANLHPPLASGEDAVDDLDSFMYQTIGHVVIPLYSQALELPLYRQEITGTAVNQSKSYCPSSGLTVDEQDETESLLPLLRKVKKAHPEINAVSTGAILSDYQRTRVESVALRLGLTPLSFLWQWPCLPPYSEKSLLDDMAVVGQDSRIIKVASGSMDDSFLWQNVADSRTVAKLSKAAQTFGHWGDGALLGEGGEYETLAIDGPAPLWKARIEVDASQRQPLQGEAGGLSLRILKPRLVLKDNSGTPPLHIRIPTVWDTRFEGMLEDLVSDLERDSPEEKKPAADALSLTEIIHDDDQHLHKSTIFLSAPTEKISSAADQMRSIMEVAIQRLSEHAHSVDDIVYTSIVMRDMADFPDINAVYGSFFTQPNPPARVTVACANALPVGAHVALAFTSAKSQGDSRKCLHVQSQSYWAPANIGPYSQAVTAPIDNTRSLVYVAGQIPLIPSSMVLESRIHGSSPVVYLCRQSVLALQHLDRIGQTMQVKQWAAAVAFVAARDEEELSCLERCARKLWTAYHSRDSEPYEEAHDAEFDVWHATQRSTWDLIHSTASKRFSEEKAHTRLPPIHIIRVDALPRGASIEWVSYGLTDASQEAVHIPHLQHLLSTFKDHIVGS